MISPSTAGKLPPAPRTNRPFRICQKRCILATPFAPKNKPSISTTFNPTKRPAVPQIILASASPIRLKLLQAAALTVATHPARIDEESIRQALVAESAPPRDMADTLAEMKARKISERFPEDLVLGCDQILELSGSIINKAETKEELAHHLHLLRGKTHILHSAAVIYHQSKPVWRIVDDAKLTMAPVSDGYLNDYIERNWESVRHSVGGYKLEEEGIRLFSAIKGDYFTILGLPLLPILSYLKDRGFLEK